MADQPWTDGERGQKGLTLLSVRDLFRSILVEMMVLPLHRAKASVLKVDSAKAFEKRVDRHVLRRTATGASRCSCLGR